MIQQTWTQRNPRVLRAGIGLLLVFVAFALVFVVTDVRPRILWTDALIYLLICVAVLFAAYASQHEHLRSPWKQVRRSRLGMVSAVVLSAYSAVGIMDSIHFQLPLAATDQAQETEAQTRYSGEILSVFDLLVRPISDKVEKTYSSPFATHAFVKENIEAADGTLRRDFPRLRYGGAHLDDPGDRAGDITGRVLRAMLWTLLVWVLIAGVPVSVMAARNGHGLARQLGIIFRGQTATPWHLILLTVAAILFIIFASIELAATYHIFGTDKVGQDIYYQALKSIRTGLVIGTLTTLVMLPFAVLLGIMAGYFRGWIDDVITYIYTTLNSIPGILLITAAVLLLDVYMNSRADTFNNVLERSDLRLLFLCMILGITSWTGLCRMLRGEALKLREMDYIAASTAMGVGSQTIITRHILPNVMHIVLIAIVLDFSGLVLAEAVLSYVGVGVDPAMNSWGNMINQARFELARDPMVWWSLLAAFIFMFILVLAANLFSDAVRDAFDPRLRSR